ncbi:HIG1 domain family member 2A, mitochondrial isoform X2 [Nematostella vectensis]|uniref:HIG1 domain family member 2A, mitochondrial isoform X2 n=1 Tax=Nematostella vectensis TaxID=45351 RepID=UPI00139058CF|nr:HIG1 domain family member 2A, mitochondrial isoform X2 [Nematostella vectensis]
MAPIESTEESRKAVYIPDNTRDETTKEKFARKVKENPFVPIGCALTVSALVYGLLSFKRGDVGMQQTMMRARVVAQGSTIVALVGGVGYALLKGKKD